jgi:hypothetical protein
LQSFGHAAVTEDGSLEIKLMGIDGSVKYSKTLEKPVANSPECSDGGSGAVSSSHSAMLTLAGLAVFGAI